MVCQRRKIIAVCASWEDEENLNLFLNQLIAATDSTGFLPLCIPFDRGALEARGEESLREYLAAFRLPDLAGFLIFGEMIRSDRINGALIALAREMRLPVFMLEREYEGCINLPLKYLEGFEQVVRHVVEEQGCRDIVMVAGIKGNSYSEDRISLCRRILEANGSSLPEDQVIYGDYWDEPTFRALDQYFGAGGHLPEAFLCANDAMAIAVCVYLSNKNIRVPSQVRVAGFDGILPGESHDPTITTARPDFSYMYRLMLRRMEAWRPEEAGRTEVCPVPYEFIRRESSCPSQPDTFLTTRRIGELKIINLMFTRHIRAMGLFISNTLSMHSLEDLSQRLSALFSRWPNPYYFAAALDEEDRSLVRPILHGCHGQFDTVAKFPWRASPVPDADRILEDPSIRIVLAQLLQNEQETMGYLVSGMQAWSLREQEKFEEEALFLSSALNAVIGNRRLKSANQAILRMAEHDYLTDLYNRRGFLGELERRLRLPENQGLTLTLFAVDMDRLKYINDTFGHQEGDHAIQCLARAIQEETRAQGLSARYGGDEFAFAVLSDRSLLAEIEDIRSRIIERAREFCGARAYQISASLGACSCPVRDHPSLDQLLARADRALYADKNARRAEGRNP